MEHVAILALQETLVRAKHYRMCIEGYRVYQCNAEAEFRGQALVVDMSLASYEIPHGLNWLTHVKVFGIMGHDGPSHILGVYLKSGGNFRHV
jgi:hypothetical protein